MTDLGLTHVALAVRDVDRSVAFYASYAAMELVHERTDPETGHRVVWLSDLSRPFVIVLVQSGEEPRPLGGINHLGVALASRDEVDGRCARARAEDREVLGPLDSGPPVGYWAIIVDPDGHNLELSHGQFVGLAVDEHR